MTVMKVKAAKTLTLFGDGEKGAAVVGGTSDDFLLFILKDP